jgi:hypothetical protein
MPPGRGRGRRLIVSFPLLCFSVTADKTDFVGLLEQKGVHKDAPGHGASTEAGGKEKVGLKDKIKAKLHKNTLQS